MIVLTKSVHIVALTIWCAGLMVLPAMFAARRKLRGPDLHELHRLARTAFISIVSPAAFVAIIAGTSLVFMRGTFTAWMALKLLAVGALATIHVREGYILLHLFEPGRTYGFWRSSTATLMTAAVICTILFLVLAKPDIDLQGVPDFLRTPGALQSLLDTINPIP